MDLSRRDIIKAGAAGLATGIPIPTMQSTKFHLKYGPHFGMFGNSASSDVDQLKFAADHGFTAWEDNGMGGRSVEEQTKLAKTMSDLGITMGVFVVNPSTAWGQTLCLGKGEGLDKFIAECHAAVDVAKRVNAKWMTVVPGARDGRLHMDYQTANVVDALRQAAEIFEPHGLVMVLEALNPFTDHPGQFLVQSPQAFQICRAVDSPSCKILFDIYHQQITEGNLIPNIDRCWSEIAYFQIGDNPGRNEPTSGEIMYKNVFKHIYEKGFKGVMGMEHGNSKPGKEGELALIDAYRWSDNF